MIVVCVDNIIDLKKAETLADIIELRLDKNTELISQKIQSSKPLILTVRSKDQGGEFKWNLKNYLRLIDLFKGKFSYLDIEYNKNYKKIINHLKKKNLRTKIILSYHNFKSTPQDAYKIFENCDLEEVHILKIATHANNLGDNFRLLNQIRDLKKKFKKEIIAFCMGEAGRISRHLTFAYGGKATFARLDKNFALGQPSIHDFTEKKIDIPSSKSILNRALICAAQASGISKLQNINFCDDVNAMIESLKKFRVKIAQKENYLRVSGGKLREPNSIIDAKDAGTVARFLMGLALRVHGKTKITANQGLKSRPIYDLVDAIRPLGAHVITTNGFLPAVISSRYPKFDSIKIKSNVSSQFLSSLLMVVPYNKDAAKIMVNTKTTSKPFVDMTLNVMKKFGVEVQNQDYQKFIIKRQKFEKTNFYIEPDATNASYFMALSCLLGKKIRINNLGKYSIQGDKKFYNILKKMGANVIAHKKYIKIEPGPLTAKTFDMNDMPDLVPTLAILSLFAHGKTKIINISNIRFKESDRIKTLATELKKLKAKVKTGTSFIEIDGLNIFPEKEITIDTQGDHRIAMAFGILTKLFPNIKITNKKNVQKSFPNFWKKLEEV